MFNAWSLLLSKPKNHEGKSLERKRNTCSSWKQPLGVGRSKSMPDHSWSCCWSACDDTKGKMALIWNQTNTELSVLGYGVRRILWQEDLETAQKAFGLHVLMLCECAHIDWILKAITMVANIGESTWLQNYSVIPWSQQQRMCMHEEQSFARQLFSHANTF